MIKYFFLFVITSLLLLACKKAEDRTCWKSTGNEIVDTIQLPDFGALILHENLEFHLVPDNSNFALVKGGEKLVKLVTFETQDTSIDIKNTNKCNFLRSYKHHIYVEIHFKQLNRLEFLGSYPLTNEDTIHSGTFNVLIHEGSETVNLTVDANSCNAEVSNGYGDFILHGQANYTTITLKQNSYCDATNFAVKQTLNVDNLAIGILKCFPDSADFNVKIESTGDVWYVGHPSSIFTITTGKGNLIDKN